MNHDLYKINEGIRINEIGDFPRFLDISSSIQFKLKGKKITSFQEHVMDSTDVSDSTNYTNSGLLNIYDY